MLLSMPFLFASSTASTARTAELVGGREIGNVDGKRVVGMESTGAALGERLGSFVGAPVGCLVGRFVGLFVDTPVPVVGEDVGSVVVPGCPTSVYDESQ